MNMRVEGGLRALTEKEKQTLRLIVRGHDAKSIARSLDLSVYTINERLRDARRKMAVSSSREAARLLLDAEGGMSAQNPETIVAAPIGGDAAIHRTDLGAAPIGGAGRAIRRPWIISGVVLMTLAFSLLALAALSQPAATPSPALSPSGESTNVEVVQAANHFLALLDALNWNESYRATGAAFRRLNSARVWAAASEKARTPLGAMISRSFLSEEDLPAPPAGYEVVKFRTSFTGKADALETVSLDREGGAWRVAGVTIE